MLLDVTDPSNIVKVYGEEDRENDRYKIRTQQIDYTDPDTCQNCLL